MKELDYNEDDETIFKMVDEVESVLSIHKFQIDNMVRMVLKELNIDNNLELRRDWDGVSSAEYMVQKMIGEYLANGKCKR